MQYIELIKKLIYLRFQISPAMINLKELSVRISNHIKIVGAKCKKVNEIHLFPICACAIHYVTYNIALSLLFLIKTRLHVFTSCSRVVTNTPLHFANGPVRTQYLQCTCMYADCKRSNFIVGNPRVILVDSLFHHFIGEKACGPKPMVCDDGQTLALRILYNVWMFLHRALCTS